MSVSVFDGVRLVVVGWQAECALIGTPEALAIANTFTDVDDVKIPSTVEECVVLGRNLLKAEIARRESERKAKHVHTIDPDLRDDTCDECRALLAKWRETESQKEIAAKARKIQSLIARVGPFAKAIEDVTDADNPETNAGVDADRLVFLTCAALVVDAIGDVAQAVDRLTRILDKE